MPRSVATLRYLPAPDALQVPQEGITLVINDGSALTPALCVDLADKGHQVVVLTFSTGSAMSNQPLQAGIAEHSLFDRSEETIACLLSQLPDSVSQCIYLHPRIASAVDVGTFAPEQEITWLKTAFLLAKLLKFTLTAEHWKTRPAFVIVVRQDGAFGTRNAGQEAILGGGLFGLVKSLNLEWPSVFCRAIDLSSELASTKAAETIRQELNDADQGLVQVAYDESGRRFTLVAEPVEPIAESSLRAQINQDSVFLVTGGGRGITAACVNQLAATFRCTFILLGRTTLQRDEPSWATGLTESTELKRGAMESLKATGEKPLPRTIERMVNDVLAQREIQMNLTLLNALGVKAYYRSVDVTNVAAVKMVLDELTPVTGPVTDILHGAGRLADKLIEHKTEADFDAVFKVKVQGLAAVMQAVSVDRIRHVVLFSSVAGFYGNVGQTDYALANEVLNRFAYLFRNKIPRAQIVSINWGAWDSGMVSPELKKKLLAHGVSLVPTDEGPQALVDQLSLEVKDQVQVVLGGTLPTATAVTNGPLQTHRIQGRMTLEANPFLEHHKIQGHAVFPLKTATAWMVQVADRFYPGFQPYRVEKVKLYKGIVFDGSQPTDFQVTLQEQKKDSEQIQALVTIGSLRNNQLPLPHYQSQIVLVRQRPDVPSETLPDCQTTTPTVADGSVLYQDGTLFHGANFQGVKQVITLDKTGALLLCEHPGFAWERQGQFPVTSVNSFLADVMYQGLLIWVRRFHNAACLPLSTDWVEMVANLPFGRPFYVSVQVIKSTEFAMAADLTAFDAVSGKVYLKTGRANVSINPDLRW